MAAWLKQPCGSCREARLVLCLSWKAVGALGVQRDLCEWKDDPLGFGLESQQLRLRLTLGYQAKG